MRTDLSLTSDEIAIRTPKSAKSGAKDSPQLTSPHTADEVPPIPLTEVTSAGRRKINWPYPSEADRTHRNAATRADRTGQRGASEDQLAVPIQAD
ncbi:hypothetical protein [Nocardia sp. NPDC059228]|uniref:hypothetical protein n=1 Tax=Nocardia sp. NPDC059228 TaxID=3346777 RepID=UPI00369C4187